MAIIHVGFYVCVLLQNGTFSWHIIHSYTAVLKWRTNESERKGASKRESERASEEEHEIN
jgi:hypothetical protein